LVATTIFTATALASGFQLNEHGARAMAQAGAFAARAYDGSAMYFNPAGLGFQTRASVLAGVTLISPSSSFFGPVQLNSNAQYDQAKLLFTPINGYIVYPVIDRLTVGVAVNNQYGLGTEWTPSTWPGRYLNQKIDLKSFFFTPTASYRITDQLSIGAGFVYATGNVKLNRQVAISSVQTPEPVTVTMDLSGHGMGFSGGLLYKITPEFSVGASYRSKVQIDASGSATFAPNYAALALPQGDVSTSITLPANGFFGVAYMPTPDIELEADYQYIGWSVYKELKFDFKANGSSSVSPKNYEDSYILRFGGQYTMAPWHFRAGYLFDHSPVKTEFVEPLLPDASRDGFNIGLGYDLNEHWSFDVAYFFLQFQTRKAENTDPSIAFDGTYKTYANLFGLNIEFKF